VSALMSGAYGETISLMDFRWFIAREQLTRVSRGTKGRTPGYGCAQKTYSRKIFQSWCIRYRLVNLTVKQGLATPLEVHASPVTCLYSGVASSV